MRSNNSLNNINKLEDTNPTRWIYEAMEAWDPLKQNPTTLGRTRVELI